MRLIVFALIALVWFSILGYRSLVDPDEGRYAEIPREMLASGDWVTPRLNGLKYFEKPALQYWATAVSYKVFGLGEGPARLWPALTGFCGALMIWLCLRRRLGTDVTACAALFVLCAPYYLFFSQVLTLDIGVSAFISAGLLLFIRAQSGDTHGAQQRNAMLLAWACLALAVLSKGLIGIVLPTLVVGVYVLMERDFSLLLRMHWGKGLLLFAAITVPWFVLVSQRNPEFPEFFFIHEHFARYTSNVHHKVEPFWFFVPILLLGTAPWTWLGIEGLRHGWRRRESTTSSFQTGRFLVLWAACVFLFFSASGSKLHGYVLSAVPPLAILAAQRAAGLSPGQLVLRLAPAVILLGLLTFVGGEVMRATKLDSPSYPIYAQAAWWIKATGGMLLVAGAVIGLRYRRRLAVEVLCLLTFAGTVLIMLGLEPMSSLRSPKGAAAIIRPLLAPDTRLYQVGRYDHGLSFYLGRTSTIAQVGGELDFGIAQEPHLALLSPGGFESSWILAPSAIAVMSPGKFDEMQAQGLPMQILSRDDRRVLVSRPTK